MEEQDRARALAALIGIGALFESHPDKLKLLTIFDDVREAVIGVSLGTSLSESQIEAINVEIDALRSILISGTVADLLKNVPSRRARKPRRG